MTTYQCDLCGGHFTSERSDADAQKEMKDNFGQAVEKTDCASVCDDCYNKIHPKPSVAWKVERTDIGDSAYKEMYEMQGRSMIALREENNVLRKQLRAAYGTILGLGEHVTFVASNPS